MENFKIENFKMENLKKLRESKHLTQTKLSTEIEVSQELISHYEIGESKPNIETLIKLANYFNCSTDYLLELTTNPVRISKLNSNDAEVSYVLTKFQELSSEKRKQLISYLEFLLK